MTARKPENTFIGAVHRHIPLNVYRLKNNNPYVGGIADCWYSGPKGDCWIEYKYLSRIPSTVNLVDRPSPKVDPTLSKLQQEWLRNRYDQGRTIFVVVGCASGGVIYRDKLWEKPITREAFEELIVSRKHIADFINSVVA